MISFDRWLITKLNLDIQGLAQLWHQLQGFPTLFSDSTRGDIRNWISTVTDEGYVWYEVHEGEQRVGVMYLQLGDDRADLHLAFFDRKVAEKRELIKHFCKFVFESLPGLHKITASIPAIYWATWRLAKEVGFHWEGTLREDVVINGKRFDVHLYSMLRNEAYGLPEEGRESRRDTGRVRSGRSDWSEARGSSVGRGVGTQGS